MAEETKEQKTQKEAKPAKVARVVEIADSFKPATELEDGTLVDSLELLVRIYNDVQLIKKAVA